jgi:RNA polymerase sigma-70 factor (ECF subfamily)
MVGEEEETLVRQAQQGHTRAFEVLITTHLPQVRRFARAFAHTDTEADDLAQEALVKVYRSIGGFRFQSSFTTWLFAVVRNAFLDVRKSRAHAQRAAEESLGPRHLAAGDGAESAEAALLQQERRAHLWRAIEQIPAEFRVVLVLFDIEGLSYEEIAAIEHVPLGTVKSRLSRGREQLRRLVLTNATPRALPVVDEGGGNLSRLGLVKPSEGNEAP